MSAPRVILDNLPSLCQTLSDLVEVWRSYNRNNFACFFWDTVYMTFTDSAMRFMMSSRAFNRARLGTQPSCQQLICPVVRILPKLRWLRQRAFGSRPCGRGWRTGDKEKGIFVMKRIDIAFPRFCLAIWGLPIYGLIARLFKFAINFGSLFELRQWVTLKL